MKDINDLAGIFCYVTATADTVAQKIIQETLQLQHPAVFRINPYRSNLRLAVQIV